MSHPHHDDASVPDSHHELARHFSVDLAHGGIDDGRHGGGAAGKSANSDAGALDADRDIGLGLASGLAAGLTGALVMTGFQALLAKVGITSGVQGPPSTERAANAAAYLVTGRRVPRARRAAAGDAVHNAVGSLVGGVYGVAAEVAPQVTAGQGAAFGVVAATVVDETLVPAFRFGDPLWRAPVVSHPYSYVSHVVFGTSTEAARQLFRRFFRRVKDGAAVLREARAQGRSVAAHAARLADASRRTAALSDARAAHPSETDPALRRESASQLLLAFMLGATAGPRTSAPLTTVSWAARLGWIDLRGSPLAFLGTNAAVAATTPMALGELVIDKLPATPDRTLPVGVGARMATGALSGAALAGGRSWQSAVAGAAGALVATYVGHSIRTGMAKAFGHDAPVAVAEDLLAFGGAAMVCVAALAPPRPRD